MHQVTSCSPIGSLLYKLHNKVLFIRYRISLPVTVLLLVSARCLSTGRILYTDQPILQALIINRPIIVSLHVNSTLKYVILQFEQRGCITFNTCQNTIYFW